MALAEVGAEVVLVLHHVPGDAQADGRGGGGSEDTGHPGLSAGVVITGLEWVYQVRIVQRCENDGRTG